MIETPVVQIVPATTVHEHIYGIKPKIPQQFAVYLGEVGVYNWLADFNTKEAAVEYASKTCDDYGAVLQDLTD